jgi:hypothetical protein
MLAEIIKEFTEDLIYCICEICFDSCSYYVVRAENSSKKSDHVSWYFKI